MKKIISVLLVAILCVSAFVSCGEDKDKAKKLDEVITMYKNCKPTKVVAESEQSFANIVLNGEYTLVVGELDGGKVATYNATYEEMRDVESGSGDKVMGTKKLVEEKKQYYAGVGTRTKLIYDHNDTGVRWSEWNKEEILDTKKGSIAINLDKSLIGEYDYADNRLSFTVEGDAVAGVFGDSMKDVKVPVSVVVIDDGVTVIGIEVSYTIPKNEETKVEETTITLKIHYSYDLEKVNMD